MNLVLRQPAGMDGNALVGLPAYTSVLAPAI
jgi:hypothetical protein